MSVSRTENICEQCNNRELCPVYSGENCLLVKEHIEEIERL